MRRFASRSPSNPFSMITTSLFLVASLATAMTLAGCSSDSPAAPELGDPGGTGSMTLLVAAEASGADAGGGAFDTNFLVTVSDAVAAPVSGATVSIQGSFGTVTLQENPLALGTYTAMRNGYATGTYTLSVISGTDMVSGVRATAPVIHTITSPSPSDIIPKDQAIDILWSRTVAAQESKVESRDYDSGWVLSDVGTMAIPDYGNPPRTDQRFRVKRANRQAAAGGLPGSSRYKIQPHASPCLCRWR